MIVKTVLDTIDIFVSWLIHPVISVVVSTKEGPSQTGTYGLTKAISMYFV